MNFNRVDYENGHYIADNGVGDYDFHCPRRTDTPFFLHMGQVLDLERVETQCDCGLAVGKRQSEFPPYTGLVIAD